jgi:hypothetical protein
MPFDILNDMGIESIPVSTCHDKKCDNRSGRPEYTGSLQNHE